MEEKGNLRLWFDKKMDWVKWKAHMAVKWCEDHKETIIVFGPVFAGVFVEIVKISTRRHTVNEEKKLKERYIYDRSTGHYYELKRQPRSSEWLQIEQRKLNGETLGMILNDMRLLK